MTPLVSTQAPNISAVRQQAEIVLRASTSTWKDICRAIEHMCYTESAVLNISVQDEGGSDRSPFPAVSTLTIRRGQAPLNQFLSRDCLVVEGSTDDLLALAGNIDCPNPFEGAHYQSDSLIPGVSTESIALVFMHGS